MTNKRERSLPRVALALLERFIAPDMRDAIIGDLAERASGGESAWSRARVWCETLAALRHFGTLASREPQSHHGGIMSFFSDVRRAARTLRRAPAFTLLCAFTLALAIGPTTAIFSIVDPLLLRPLPYDHPERIMYLWERGQDGRAVPTGFATLQDFRANATTLESIAGVGSWKTTLSDPTAPERLDGSRISWNYFRTLGVSMALGRDFVAEEDRPGQDKVVILTHGLWVRRFGGDSSIVGRSIMLDGTARTVVGVLPDSYEDVHYGAAQIYKPLAYAVTLAWGCRTCRHLTAIARLRNGVTRARANIELDQISARLVAAYPKEYPAPGTILEPMQDRVTAAVRPAVLAIAGAVVLVLLIAIANVVNLQLARAVRRRAEFGVRLALGAGASRLAQQLVAEGLVIALMGAVFGVVFGWLTMPALVAHLPREFPRLSAIHFDVAALLVVTAVIVPLAIVLGVVPAFGARRRALFDGALRGATRVSSGDHHRTRAMLVVAEMALALMLLSSAALLARSLTRLLGVNAGFDPSHLITVQVESSGPRYRTNAAIFEYRQRVLDALHAVPEVSDAAIATSIPLGGDIDRYGVIAQDKPLANPELAPYATGYRVVGDYLRTMRIRLVTGRDFAPAEQRDTATAVAIVSASLARTVWPGEPIESAIGKRVHIPNAAHQWSTVVGVAADVRHQSLDAADEHAVYLPEVEWGWFNSDAVVVARTKVDNPALAARIQSAVKSVDPSQPVTGLRTMDVVVASSAAQRRLALTLFGAFAILALLLAAAGIYGVLAGSVAERTREIGVRSALGATSADLVRMVLRRGLGLASTGAIIGVGGALETTHYLRSLLYGVEPTDPVIIGASIAVLLFVATAACLVPARRAVRIDPVEALRDG